MLPLQGARVQSLVGELRSRKPRSVAKNKNNHNNNFLIKKQRKGKEAGEFPWRIFLEPPEGTEHCPHLDPARPILSFQTPEL